MAVSQEFQTLQSPQMTRKVWWVVWSLLGIILIWGLISPQRQTPPTHSTPPIKASPPHRSAS